MSRSMLLGLDHAPIATLDTALRIGYELKRNELSTAEIQLASDDPVAALCTPRAIAHLWDGTRDLGLYRVSASPASDLWAGGIITISLEHMLATLLDDLVFTPEEHKDVPFRAIMEHYLDMQSEHRWQLGDCEFDKPISTSVGRDTILATIRSICDLLGEPYALCCDTSALPYILHVRRADTDASCGIHYGRSMAGITRQMDASTLVTRLYLLGGAGKDGKQVDVTGVNGGMPYIDADTIGDWGIRSAIYETSEITDAQELLRIGRNILERRKNPRYAYEARAIDLYRMTGDDWDAYEPGKLVMVTDDDHGVRFTSRIVSVAKEDVNGDPGSITITIANAEEDEVDMLSALTGMAQQAKSDSIGLTAASFAAANRAAGMMTLIKENAEEILLRATWEAHSELGQSVMQAQSDLSVQADAIKLLGDRTTTIEGQVTEDHAQLIVNNGSIGMLVSRSEAIDGRVTSAEASIEMYAGKLDAKADVVRVEALETQITGLVTMEEFQAVEGWADYFIGNGISANDISAVNADFSSLVCGNINHGNCAPHTLSIGGKSCTFYGPSDATFELSDMPGYDAAMDAARTEGAASVYAVSMEVYDGAYDMTSRCITAKADVTLSSGMTSAIGITVDASSAYDAGYEAGWEAAKAAISVEGEITAITNPAQGYYMATGWAGAKLDGVTVKETTFRKAQSFGA